MSDALTPELESQLRKTVRDDADGRAASSGLAWRWVGILFAELDRIRAALSDRDRQLAELREACQPLADAWRVYVSESGIPVALTTFRLMVHAEPLRRLAALLPPTPKEADRAAKE